MKQLFVQSNLLPRLLEHYDTLTPSTETQLIIYKKFLVNLHMESFSKLLWCLFSSQGHLVTQNLVSCVQQQRQVEDGEPETIVIKEDLNDQWERSQTQAIIVQDGE